MVFSREEMRANGRLIAVAPRMLEALQIAKTEFEARDGAGTCPVEIEELLEELSQHNADLCGSTKEIRTEDSL